MKLVFVTQVLDGGDAVHRAAFLGAQPTAARRSAFSCGASPAICGQAVVSK